MPLSPDRIYYAGSNRLRTEFLKHATDGHAEVIPLGSGIELHALHPLSIAQGKITRAQRAVDEPIGCCVAFDTLTYAPKPTQEGLVYEARGKPRDETEVQQLFWEMSGLPTLPYRIRSASVLQCNGEETTAWHDASITLSPHGLALLCTNAGFSTYVSHVRDFGYPFGQNQSPLTMTAGLNLEALLALGCVEAIDGVYRNQHGFETSAERALFLATVGASHKVLGPLAHDPMKHIITFPFYRDNLALLRKYTGAT